VLNRLLDKKSAALVLLYGRRRVEKVLEKSLTCIWGKLLRGYAVRF
jgi:hypothetical protein